MAVASLSAPASSGGPAGLAGGRVTSSGVLITGLPSQAEGSCLGSPQPT